MTDKTQIETLADDIAEGAEAVNASQALQAVADAWNAEGRDPVEHRRQQARLRHEWPTLAKAVEAAARATADARATEAIAHTVAATTMSVADVTAILQTLQEQVTEEQVARATAAISRHTDHPGMWHVDWPDDIDAPVIARTALEAAREARG